MYSGFSSPSSWARVPKMTNIRYWHTHTHTIYIHIYWVVFWTSDLSEVFPESTVLTVVIISNSVFIRLFFSWKGWKWTIGEKTNIHSTLKLWNVRSGTVSLMNCCRFHSPDGRRRKALRKHEMFFIISIWFLILKIVKSASLMMV